MEDPSFFTVVYCPEDQSIITLPESKVQSYTAQLTREGLSYQVLGTGETEQDIADLLTEAGVDSDVLSI